MPGYLSHRWSTAAILTLLALSGAAPDARAGDRRFYAAGAFQVVDSNGSHFFIVGDGQADPGGPFTATAETHLTRSRVHETGVMTLDFGRGDTLTISFVDDWVDDLTYPDGGYRVGSYVVTGGAGRLAAASGSGAFRGVPSGNGTGTFEFDGTLSR